MTLPETRAPSLLAEVSRLRRSRQPSTLGEVPWSAVHPDHRAGAENLAAYLELRRHDIRELQAGLAGLGLSSLGRLESDVIGSVRAVETALLTMSWARAYAAGPAGVGDLDSGEGLAPDESEVARVHLHRRELARNTIALLGPPSGGRATRIMVLDDILRRMAEHQDKKRSLLRRLRAWDDAFAPLPDALSPDPPTPVH